MHWIPTWCLEPGYSMRTAKAQVILQSQTCAFSQLTFLELYALGAVLSFWHVLSHVIPKTTLQVSIIMPLLHTGKLTQGGQVTCPVSLSEERAEQWVKRRHSDSRACPPLPPEQRWSLPSDSCGPWRWREIHMTLVLSDLCPIRHLFSTSSGPGTNVQW